MPVTYRLVTKTESYIDKQGKRKRRSRVTKNEHFRAMLQNCVRNRIPCRYVLNDIWFAAAENMSSQTQVSIVAKRKFNKPRSDMCRPGAFPLYLLDLHKRRLTAVRYLVTSDSALTAVITIYQKRWKVEEYLLSQAERIPRNHLTRTPTTQTNHFAALWTFTKLELLKVREPLCAQEYLSALQQAALGRCASWNQRNMSH